MSNGVEIKVEICRKDSILPKYSNHWDAGMDIYAAEEVIILAGKTALVPTGLKMAIPEGYELQVRPRSGLSLKTPLRLANSPGTIDSGYRDEIGIIITNTSNENTRGTKTFDLNNKDNENGDYKISKGDRVAQFVLCEVPRVKFEIVENIKDFGIGRGGGFGSTGVI
jgi:dUTP pyrophosphatase